MIALGAIGLMTLAQLYYPQAIIPEISADYAVTPAAAALTVSGATLGLAAAVLVWAWLAGRIGRATSMKIALVGAALLGLAIPFAPSLEMLVALRVLQGVALAGTPGLVLTYLYEEVQARDAMIATGIYISATATGGVAGRLMVAPFADLADWRAGAFVVGILSLLAALLVIFVMPPDRRFRPVARGGRPRAWRVSVRALAEPRLRPLFAQAFVLMGAHVAIYNYLAYRLVHAPFWLSTTVASLIFVVSLSGSASARAATGFAVRWGRRPVLLVSGALMGAGVALTIPDWLPTVLLGLAVFTAAFFAAHAIASGWVAPVAGANSASATSLYTLFYYVGSSLFGWLGGLAFAVGWTGTAMTVLGLSLCSVLLAWRMPTERT